jgi:hypothetical protein
VFKACRKCDAVTERYDRGDCKACARRRYFENRAHRQARHAAWDKENRALNREKQRALRAKKQPRYWLERSVKRHGLTLLAFDALLAQQNGACAVCLSPFESTPQVDHDHACCPKAYSCGKCVRGLLCELCNRTLGHAKDSVSRLLALAKYLDRREAIHV